MSNFPQKTHKLKGMYSYHNWTLLRRLPYKPSEASNKRLQWRCRCVCGTEEDVPEYYMMRPHSPKKDCGCKRKTIITLNKREHGIWNMMHVRCYNEKHVAFKHYGGRGIKVCAEWHKDHPEGKGFENFLAFVGNAPTTAHSIDRVNNNVGYQPYFEGKVQVRWATSKQQRANQRTPEEIAAQRNSGVVSNAPC